VVTTFLVWFFANLSQNDENFLDTAQSWNLPDPSKVPVSIVDVDDATVAALGYPFTRAYYGHLLDVLARGGAKWVVFDIVFDTRRHANDGRELYPGEDSAFAMALHRHPNVTLAGQIPTAETNVGSARMRTIESKASIAPLPEFLDAAPKWGAVQTKSETDGIARRYFSGWYDLDGKPRLSLATRALVDLGMADSADLMNKSPWNSHKGFRIRFFGGAHTFPTHSMLTVIDDSSFETPSEKEWGEHLDLSDSLIQAGAFRGRIVLVGSSAMLNQDLIQSPLTKEKNFPGVELHAHAMGTWLLKAGLRDIPPWITWLLLLLLSWPVLVWNRKIGNWWLIPVPGLLFSGIWSGSVLLLAGWGGWAAPLTSGALAGFLCMLASALERYVTELARKREITRTFGQYLSPEVVKIMTSDPSKVQLGGQRGEITVLFSDFQGFTKLSEQIPPEQFVPQIGECFTAMTAHILEQFGILDKYMGDAIMAEFGIPLPLEDKAIRACRAAWRMQTSLAKLREEWATQGLPGLHMRVGVATGPALFGNMGSRQMFDYTALGDTVNLGSRLEGVNKAYGTRVLIEGTTRLQAQESITARLIDHVRVVGKSQAVEVWQLVHVAGEPESPLLSEESLSLWQEIRAAWDEADFVGSRERTIRFLEMEPNDPPAKLFLERLDELIRNGKPEDWDGAVTLDHK